MLEKNKLKQFRLLLLFSIVTFVLYSPPIHEGLHAVSCGLQGKEVTNISWDHITCSGIYVGEDKERLYAMPYIPSSFFLGATIMLFCNLIKE